MLRAPPSAVPVTPGAELGPARLPVDDVLLDISVVQGLEHVDEVDEDVLLFWMPGAEVAFATGAIDALPDPPSADPARWFDRFVTTGEDRADP